MRYTEFRDEIAKTLRSHQNGMTWKELREELNLPYKQPCSEWVASLEKEINLTRQDKKGNAYLWKIPSS